MTPDEATAEQVLAGVMAGCFGNPPHDATAFRWRVVQDIAAALVAEREACARVAEAHRAAEAPDAGLPAAIASAIRARGAA